MEYFNTGIKIISAVQGTVLVYNNKEKIYNGGLAMGKKLDVFTGSNVFTGRQYIDTAEKSIKNLQKEINKIQTKKTVKTLKQGQSKVMPNKRLKKKKRRRKKR